MASKVYDLRTGNVHVEYTCSAREAVVAAFEQEKGNYNTWEYDPAQAVVAGRFVTCGDFTCRITP